MPELPEVENIAEGLRHEIVGHSIKSIYVKKPIIVRGPYRRSWRRAAQLLTHQPVTCVTRRGKRLIIVTKINYGIIVQLGMTGKLLINPPDAPLAKHTHFLINFNKNKQLRFIDVRRFGRLWFLDHLDPQNLDLSMTDAGLATLGPEPFAITRKQFTQTLNSQRVIKTLLLDQTRLAGLGNIYVDESLFLARIHPTTRACDIKPKQVNKLHSDIRRILNRAIAHGGTSFSDYRNAYGEMGNFLKRLKVYQRNGLPCPRCGTVISRLVITGRSSHFCPQCQPQK